METRLFVWKKRLLKCLPGGGLVLTMLVGRFAAALPPAPDTLRPVLAAARTPAARQAACLRVAAAFAALPDVPAATAYAAAAAVLATQRRDASGQGRAASLQGFVLLQTGDAARAAPLLRRAETLLAAAPLPWQADNHAYLAWLLGDTQQPTEALRYLRRARAEYGRLGNAAAQAELSGTATVVYLYQGRGDSAALVLLQAARQQHRLGLAQAEGATLGNLASVLHQLDRLPEADRYARQALATFQRLHAPDQASGVYQTLGNIAWARHRPAEAVPYYRTCLRGLTAQHLEGQSIPCLGSLAGALSDLGRLDSAIYYQTRAVQLCQQQGQTSQLATEMGALAQIYGKARRWPEAERWATASLAAQGSKKLQDDRALLVLVNAATARADFRQALAYEHQARLAAKARSARESQRLVQEQRARFETDRAEQKVALLTARTQLQADAQELNTLRYRQRLIGLGGLGLLGLALAGGLLWRYRRRQAAQEEILRNRLAADLHDDVGTLLSQISMQSGILQEGLADAAGQRQQLGQISEASRAAVRQLNDVVWSLDAHNDHLPNLLDRMRDYAHELVGPLNMVVVVTASPELPARRLPVLLRRNLYLIYKEALHNITKHVPLAHTVTVSLTLEEGKWLVLQVDDDGFPAMPDPVGAPPRRSGHGLRNIAQRAAACGGTAECGRVFSGFRVRVRVPLAAG